MQPHPFRHTPISVNTLAEIKRHKYTIRAYCPTLDCEFGPAQGKLLDIDILIERLGPDFYTVNKLKNRLYCTACRHRNLSGRFPQISFSPPCKTPNDRPFGHLTNPGGVDMPER